MPETNLEWYVAMGRSEFAGGIPSHLFSVFWQMYHIV